MGTLRFLLEKEFRQFIRNSFMPKMVVMFPLVVMLVMPLVMTMDIRHIGVAVVDRDHSEASRRLTEKIAASDYFSLQQVTADYASALLLLEEGEVDVILDIPDRFDRSLTTSTPRKVSIAANGVNAIKGSFGAQYLTQVVAQTFTELRSEQGLPQVADAVVVQNRYNPTLDYQWFMIPALMIMLIVMLCGFLPALNLVGEKETGTIEQINVTPVGRFTFTLAKLIPFWVIGFVVLTLAMMIAWAVYGLTPAGNVGAIYLAAALFILSMSGIGVIVANHSSMMQQAMFVMFFFVMVFVLMSGLITPVESMPGWAQTVTLFTPPRYFVDAMRSVYLKGTSVAELWMDYSALCGFAVVLNLWAALSYRKRM